MIMDGNTKKPFKEIIKQINEAMTSLAQGGHDAASTAQQIEQAVAGLERMGGELQAFVGGRTSKAA